MGQLQRATSPARAGRLYRSMPEIAYQHIREGILSGVLSPGAAIDQETVARELGMSRMPIREALQRLAQDGLVATSPHRTAIVAPITADDVCDLYLVWTVLEGLAMELSVANHAGESLPHLRELHAQMANDSSANDTLAWVQHNREFHSLLHGAVGSPRLTRLLSDLWDNSTRFMTLYSEVADGRTGDSVQEHEEILQAYTAHEAQRAAALTRQHLTKTRDELVAHLLQRSQ